MRKPVNGKKNVIDFGCDTQKLIFDIGGIGITAPAAALLFGELEICLGDLRGAKKYWSRDTKTTSVAAFLAS